MLHQLNARIQADPGNKLSICKQFYLEQVASDASLADIVLIVRNIVEAGGGDLAQETEHLRVGIPVLMFGMALMALVSLAAIGGGILALIKSANGQTELHIWGTTVSTQNVGVAFTALGVIVLGGVIRAAFKRVSLRKR